MMGPGDGGFNKMMAHSGNLGSMGSGYDPGFGSLMGAMNSLNVGSNDLGNADASNNAGLVGQPGGNMGVPPPPTTSRFFNDWRIGDNKRGTEDAFGSDFARAPGSKNDGISAAGGTAGGSGLLGGPSDGTWSNQSGKSDGGWPDSGSGQGNARGQSSGGGNQWSSGTNASSNYNMPDVPEFEPGKPWKVQRSFLYFSDFNFSIWRGQPSKIIGDNKFKV